MEELKLQQIHINKSEEAIPKQEEISAKQLENIKEVFKLNPDLKQAVVDALDIKDTQDIKIELGRSKENILGKVQNINVYYKGNLIIDSDNVNNKLFLVTKEDGTSYVGDIFLPEELQGKGLGLKILQKVSDELDTKIIPTYLSTGGFTSDNAKKMWDKVGNEIKPSHEAERLYAKYLETIFPESKVRDIVWHSSAHKITNFHKQEDGLDQFHFSKGKETIWKLLANPDGGNVYQIPVKLDIKNLKSEEFDEEDHAGQTIRMATWKKQGFDGVYIVNSNHPEDSEIAVFNNEQVYILDSEQDVENFKKWIEENKNEK